MGKRNGSVKSQRQITTLSEALKRPTVVRPEDEMPAAKKQDTQLLEDAKKAEAAADEHRDTPEKKSARMKELEGTGAPGE